ncbi:MAG: hypothetical protein GX999_01875 [Bacteroidales bacterium]|jgi:predicted RNase H-related nuclease YkuK (DUF458 family)|nr:hypothetical protein [Bacteroidales bacterium]
METQTDTLDLIVKLASLGTAGISILGIFYTGIIVKSLPNDVTSGKLSAVRMYKNMCIVVAIICAISGGLNAFFNMQKVMDAKDSMAKIENNYTNQADSLDIIRSVIISDLAELKQKLAAEPCEQTVTSEIIQRINTNVNSLSFKAHNRTD